MDETIEKVLSEYETRASREAGVIDTISEPEMLRRRDDFLLPVGRGTGTLLNVLAREMPARTMLEIGCAYGYSTIWLAQAARETDGVVVSLEMRQEKIDYARQMLERAGLAEYVSFIVGDARATLNSLDLKFDLVLLDLWKDLYVRCFDMVLPKLNPGAIIVADNMLYPESTRPQAELYRVHVRTRHDIDSVLLPVGSGIEVTRFHPTRPSTVA
jgi:predicted O-methyltransferase YrrM